jgi:hypothetical protein
VHDGKAVIVELAGATLEGYDEVIAKMGFTPGGSGAPGSQYHCVTRTDDGIRVTNVWRTAQNATSSPRADHSNHRRG